MRKYQFIHPITGEVFFVLCEKLEEYGTSGQDYWWCIIGGKIVAQFPQSYAMCRIDDDV